jgi:hypothetical protein
VNARTPSASLRALVARLVDYAGLFPPAGLPMREAVRHYAEYLDSPDAWMLGRFVVPVARLDELAADASAYAGSRAEPWQIAALVGDDASADAERIRAFNASHIGRLNVDVAEVKATGAARIESAMRALGAELTVYVELPVDAGLEFLLSVVRRARARAKIRTGGVTGEAFPTAAQVARFIARCADHGVQFKATAGLHHPLRGEHRLTYADDASSATMFGFLNVFVASAFALTGMREDALRALLEETEASALAFGDDGLSWRGHRLSLDALTNARSTFAVAFGSCSFREPVDDLHRLALL